MDRFLDRKELLKQLEKCLKKLDLRFIYTDIVKEIPNLTWTDIKQYAVRKNIALTTKEVTRIICKYVSKSEECDKNKLMELISITDLIYIAKYSIRKTWQTFKLVKRNSNPIQTDQIKQTLRDTFRYQKIKNQINFYHYDGIIWIRIFIFKTAKSTTISKNYFAIMPQEDYIFSINKKVDRLVIDALKMALDSREIIEKPLTGRIIKSLIKLLKNKENKTQNFDAVECDIVFPDYKRSFTKTDIGYNFLKNTIRNEYANKVLGEEPEILQSLLVKPKNPVNVRELLNNNKLPEKFDIQLRINSPNVMDCVKNLIENNIISTPAPNWCTNLPYSGANIIDLKRPNE